MPIAYQWMSEYASPAKKHFIKFTWGIWLQKVIWRSRQGCIKEKGIEDICDFPQGPPLKGPQFVET